MPEPSGTTSPKASSPRRAATGRDPRYNPGHLERLELIAELQARGLKLEAIKSLLGRVGKRSSVSEWLGIDGALRASWTDDQPANMTLAEVHERLGRRPRRLVGELVDAGLLVRQDDGSFLAPSDAMLDLTLRLLDASVSIDVAGRAANLLRRRLAKAADDLVKLFDDETGRSFAGRARPKRSPPRSTRSAPLPSTPPDSSSPKSSNAPYATSPPRGRGARDAAEPAKGGGSTASEAARGVPERRDRRAWLSVRDFRYAPA